jgi:hypothetical protein
MLDLRLKSMRMELFDCRWNSLDLKADLHEFEVCH